LDARLLQEDWLSRFGSDATAVLVLLALAADKRGSSFYGRERMAVALGLTRSRVDQALARLLELGLVAHRPWREGLPDGVWQLLPLPSSGATRGSGPVSIAQILTELGIDA
jgi:hypothetical protein